jgi:predicted NAD/FAD-binding protein
VEQYLLPMGSAIWSCPTGCFADFPIRFVVEFFRNHGLLSLRDRPTWHVVAGGSHTYVKAIAKKLDTNVRLRSPVAAVTRLGDCVRLQTCSGQLETFDHVIFACHSDQALRILGNGATALERDVLSSFPYVSSLAVLHTDTSILPRRREAWASWNYLAGQVETDLPVVTYNMNILQGLKSRHTFCVTLNAESKIDPAKILGRYVYHHPTFDARRAAAQARHPELMNSNRTSFCGAYWRNGFHEDGVVSALNVVAAIRQHSGTIQVPHEFQSVAESVT